MAGKTAKATLGGVEYTFKKFNIGELEEIADIIDTAAPRKAAFQILRLAFKRVEPAASLDDIEADPVEIATTVTALMKLAGLEAPVPAGDPPKPPDIPAGN